MSCREKINKPILNHSKLDVPAENKVNIDNTGKKLHHTQYTKRDIHEGEMDFFLYLFDNIHERHE